MQPNIVFLDEYSLGDADLGSIRALGNYTGYRTTVREEVADRCREADVVITNKVVFRRETLRQLPRLRLICVAATGMNHIDLEAAAELGIAVKNAVGYSTHAVTETTIGAAIGLLRQTVYYDRYVKTEYAGSPLQYHFGRTTHQLYGSKWGIVGLGNIGRSVARVAEALGCRIAYTSTSGVVREEPYPEKPLDELLRWADVVSVHAPLNDRTRNLIGARTGADEAFGHPDQRGARRHRGRSGAGRGPRRRTARRGGARCFHARTARSGQSPALGP